jgi:hypothetical protein
MTKIDDCQDCAAFGAFCEGQADGAVRCRELGGWLEALDGLALDMPLAPQPEFELPAFFPQLLNNLEVPSVLAREPVVAAGIAKVLTPRGQVSRRAILDRYGPHSLRAQWGIGEDTRLVCIGNYLDDYLEGLWGIRDHEDVWGRLQALGFETTTSLNFSIYLDRPRLEHLVNIKRTWLTVERMQATSGLIPIPHLQWAQPLDLQRQLHYALEQGFHTLTLNLQMIKRQGWDTVAEGIPVLQEWVHHEQGRTTHELRLLFTGVVGLKRLAELAQAFPTASFTNTAAHYLAQRHVRLHRDGTRLIKEPVDGHPDLILAENVRLYRDFLAEVRGTIPQPSHSGSQAQPSTSALSADLQARFGLTAEQAYSTLDLLATDDAILEAFQRWLFSGELDRSFQGSFPTWPCADVVPHPTLGQLLDQGRAPLDAFLHLADLAHQVDEEIQVFVGRAGY